MHMCLVDVYKVVYFLGVSRVTEYKCFGIQKKDHEYYQTPFKKFYLLFGRELFREDKPSRVRVVST